MKKIALVFISLLLMSCPDNTTGEDEILSSVGTVTYLDFEGGFYGIVTDDQEHHDPINLDEKFKNEGERIFYSYKIRKDSLSFHMWGNIIEITNISLVSE
jgi:hypothetical protein